MKQFDFLKNLAGVSLVWLGSPA